MTHYDADELLLAVGRVLVAIGDRPFLRSELRSAVNGVTGKRYDEDAIVTALSRLRKFGIVTKGAIARYSTVWPDV